jgi:hypothetical protein
MGEFDGGFWAAISIFAGLGVLMNAYWIINHIREKNSK